MSTRIPVPCNQTPPGTAEKEGLVQVGRLRQRTCEGTSASWLWDHISPVALGLFNRILDHMALQKDMTVHEVNAVSIHARPGRAGVALLSNRWVILACGGQESAEATHKEIPFSVLPPVDGATPRDSLEAGSWTTERGLECRR